MKTRINLILLNAIALVGVLTFASCGDDDPDPILEDPVLSINGNSEVTLKPDAAINVNLNITADGGVSSIIVNRNGGFLEEIEITNPETTTFEYTGQSVPGNAIEGDEIGYEFIAVNTQETQSAAVAFSISVALYDLVNNSTVGDVYEVSIPTDGLVPSGTSVTFAAGRSYYVASTLVFQDGSSFSIEEGVTVYINAADTVDHKVEIQGTAGLTIEGTATAPVVMTSSKIMTGDDPEPKDWEEFRLQNTTNSVIKYLRIEYGTEAFRVDECDNSNDISYVAVFRSSGEGVYITDGNVNMKYIAAIETGDSNFRLGDAYTGNLQFLIAYNSGEGEEAFYLRGVSDVTIANVTVVGPGKETKADGFENAGIRFRSDVGGKVYNAVVTGQPDWGVRSSDDPGDALPTDIDGPVVLAYSNVYDNHSRDDEFGNIFFDEVNFMNSEDAVAGITVGSIVPSNEASSGFDPSSLGNFFSAGAFKGAIQNTSNDWTVGWVKNPDGSLR